MILIILISGSLRTELSNTLGREEVPDMSPLKALLMNPFGSTPPTARL